MKRAILAKIDKEALQAMPRAEFKGRIITIITESDARKAVDYLLASSDILGVDTETKPVFRRGQHSKVALLQVANREACILFRLNYTGLTPDIVRLLEDTTIKKIGLSWHDDILSLQRRAPFEPGLFIDIQHIVKELGVEDASLQKLYAIFFGKKVSKAQRLTNWEADVLKDAQKQYAAGDAWACIDLYDEIQRLITTGDYELVKPAEESAPQCEEPAGKE